MIGSTKITKKEFYKLGGLANPKLFRKSANGVWSYWKQGV